MRDIRQYTIIGIFFVLITGSLAHFLYNWSGKNVIVGLFTPINESIWEHMKLLFYPMMLYALLMIIKFRKNYPCITLALYFGIVIGTFLIPVFYYTYTSILGKNSFILDISTFILSIVIAFWLSYKLTRSGRLEAYTSLFCILVCVLLACFFVFTYFPPDSIIFQDPIVSF